MGGTQVPVEKLQIPSVYVTWETGAIVGGMNVEIQTVVMKFKTYVTI